MIELVVSCFNTAGQFTIIWYFFPTFWALGYPWALRHSIHAASGDQRTGTAKPHCGVNLEWSAKVLLQDNGQPNEHSGAGGNGLDQELCSLTVESTRIKNKRYASTTAGQLDEHRQRHFGPLLRRKALRDNKTLPHGHEVVCKARAT